MPLLFGTIGPLEIGVIVLIAILIFGAKKLPQLGQGLGLGIRNFKDSLSEKNEKDSKPPEEGK